MAKKREQNPKAKAAKLKIKVLPMAHAKDLPAPAYQSPGAAGFDLVAAVDAGAPLTLRPGERVLVPTGLILELPEGMEGQVRPRSGLALKHGVTVLNSPGTIDGDYRGEVQVILINHGETDFLVSRGERIAQLVLAPVVRAKLKLKSEVSATKRGAGGFGSTGGAGEAKPTGEAAKKSAIAAKLPAMKRAPAKLSIVKKKAP